MRLVEQVDIFMTCHTSKYIQSKIALSKPIWTIFCLIVLITGFLAVPLFGGELLRSWRLDQLRKKVYHSFYFHPF